MKKQLREFVEADVELLDESSESGLPKFRGIFQKADEENRNKRIYSRKLWESVLESESLQRKLKDRTMLGEINHPDYRDPNPENASHVVTKLWLSEDGTKVYGEAEILPTPKGKVLEALIKSGVKIGVSSRGEGTLEKREGKDYVKEDSYHLSTFDAVLEPSVETAVPSLIESQFGVAVQNMLDSGTLNESTLEVLESLTETFTDKDISAALKNQILEAKTNNSKQRGSNSMENLKEALDKIQELNTKLSEKEKELVRQEENSKNLRNEVARVKKENHSLKGNLAKAIKEAKQVSTLKSTISEKEQQLEKAVAVIDGIKKKFDEVSSEKTKVTGFYEKALEVLEGVKTKLNSGKVEEFLSENLKSAGGYEKYKSILGPVDQLSLSEARTKVTEIKKLVGDKTPFNESVKLREDTSEEETPTPELKEGVEKEMGAILGMI